MADSRLRVISELQASHDGFDVSNDRTLKALHSAEERHFWHQTRNELIDSRIRRLGAAPPSRILDLGCGGGCVAAYLSQRGFVVVGIDGQRSLVELAAKRAPSATFYLHDLSRGVSEVPEGNFDVVGLFDVIEHLEQPLQALRAATSMLRPGGFLVGTVPSLMLLWSAVDELAGHRRRYEISSLRSLLEQVPECSVREISPFNRSLVPLMWVQRKTMRKQMDRASMSESNLSVPSRPLNWAMASVLRLERRLGAYLERLPIEGSSLWFAIEKQ